MKDPGPGQVTLACGCVSRCTVLHFERFAPFQDDPAEWYFDVYTTAGERSSRWRRFKLALKIALGRDHFCHAAIWADEEIEPLRRLLNNHVPVVYWPNYDHTGNARITRSDSAGTDQRADW